MKNPTPRAWFALAVFFAAAMLSYTDRLILNLLVEPIRHDLLISDVQISYLQGAAFAVIYALVGLPLGRLADRHNRRNIVLAGIVLWSIATAACGFCTSFWQFAIARVFVGIGEATLAPAVMSMIPDFFPPARRGTAIAVFLAGMTMGGGMATLSGGLLLKLINSGAVAFLPVVGSLAPWRGVLVLLAMPGVLIALLMIAIREPLRSDVRVSPSQARFGDTLAYFRERKWMFAGLFGAFALLQLVDYGFSAWLPAMMGRRFGVPASDAGPMIGMIAIAFGGLGTLLGGLLADRLVRRGSADARLRVTLMAYLIALPTFAFPLMPSSTSSLALYAGYSIASAIGSSAGLAATQDAVPAQMRGFSVSLQAFLYTLFGLGVGPTVVALTTQTIARGPAGVALAMMIVAIPACLLSLLLLAVVRRPYGAVVEKLAHES
ncbi:MAG: MFS transporter [Rhizomicrobium sp.]|jgi:MFS family permease